MQGVIHYPGCLEINHFFDFNHPIYAEAYSFNISRMRGQKTGDSGDINLVEWFVQIYSDTI